ncbi:hypothetical protein [Aquisalimonas sp.]|uniref:hypothetical protein n=1 Tax=Aquisalimonas sp. TaxID=1872621 RepID=UPI0025C0249D|nr:hypothetical protein [Aquisalimonas sp.]
MDALGLCELAGVLRCPKPRKQMRIALLSGLGEQPSAVGVELGGGSVDALEPRRDLDRVEARLDPVGPLAETLRVADRRPTISAIMRAG